MRQYKGLSSPLTIADLDAITTNGDEETSNYDVAGNLVSAVDYASGIYEATYDLLGRVESEEKIASGKETISKSFEYDVMGQMNL